MVTIQFCHQLIHGSLFGIRYARVSGLPHVLIKRGKDKGVVLNNISPKRIDLLISGLKMVLPPR
jgi:hypothetical protein